MRRRSTLLVLGAALALSSPVRAAPADAGARARVDGLLGSYRPVTVAEWRALGPAAAPELEAVARDAAALPTRRARALAALGVVRREAAAPLVRQLASDRSVPPLLRSAAVDVAPGVLGAETVVFLTPFLRDPDVVVRQRAAEALAASGSAGCRAVLAEVKARPDASALAKTAATCAEELQHSGPAER